MSTTGRPMRYTDLPNNTAKSWWNDKCLRVNMMHCIGLCGTLYFAGYDGSLFNSLQAIDQWQEYFNYPTGNILGLAGAALYLPSVFTAFVAEWIASKYGKRWAIWIGSVIVIAGAIVNSASTSFGMYIGGRAVMGVGSAMALTCGPTLLQEIAHPRYRATIGGFYTAIYYIAASVSSWTSFGTLHLSGNNSWRIPAYLQVVGPALVILLTLTCPESPRWLVSKGQNDKAESVLAKYHANGEIDDALVQHEFSEIVAALADEEASKKVSYMDFLRTEPNRRRLAVICVISVGTNWVGNALVSFYLSDILKTIGITTPAQIAGINGGLAIWNLILSTLACLYIEKLGRRFLWLTSTIGMLFSYCVITGLSAGYATNGSRGVGLAVIPCLFIFYGFYDIAWTPLAYAYPVEILPFHMRVKGMAIWVSVQNVAIAVNTWVNPIALDAIAWKYYFVYIGLLIFFSVFIYLYFPETKGLTIEEISYVFDAGRKGGRDRAAAHLAELTEVSKTEKPHHLEDKTAASATHISSV
ncbi:hypothetical protein EHS25_002220 [Saitozyma podzolica]|uniref:Major facilitator superfamily (MFS) profile domain-containing protein n=1 Tax=Saitozyma podzolica TaxID=1890683 RepID=A0A427YER8_9TREE|nr:hypothetical protein EHS25_002220 [Saitozyma podzolica]